MGLSVRNVAAFLLVGLVATAANAKAQRGHYGGAVASSGAAGSSGATSADYRRFPAYGYGSYFPRSYSSHGFGGYGAGGFGYSGGHNNLFAGEREIYPEWFEVDDPKQCGDVPAEVKTGRPKDLCGDDDLGSRFCLCVKRRSHYGRTDLYEPVCGECRDPCALRFVPDRYPKKNYDNDNNNAENYEEAPQN